MKRFIVPLLLMMVAAPCMSYGKCYYVDNSVVKSKEKGSASSPFLTINKAVDKAYGGDTILVKEGVYRERVIPIRSGEEGKPIVFMGEPHKKVVIKGSNEWAPDWKHLRDGIYYAVPDKKMFNDIPKDYIDSHNPFEVELSSTPYSRAGLQELRRDRGGNKSIVYTCGQVIVNGKLFTEVTSVNELDDEANSWYYNPTEKAIYVNFADNKPSEQSVEIATRRRIFAPSERGLGYIVVQGFVMEHCGNQYPTNFWVKDTLWPQRGALGIEAGHDWVIRRNVIRYAKANAIDCGYVDSNTPKDMPISNNLIEENYIVENGASGILSNRSIDMVIRYNVVVRNNTMQFEGYKRYEHAGIKCHHPERAYIHDNYVADQYRTDGIWLDNHFPDARVSRNVIVNNGKRGIFIEMSDYQWDRLMIDNNIIVGNSQNAIYCHDSSGITILHNIIANTPSQDEYGQGLMVRQVSARTKSYCNTVYNNIFAGNKANMEFCYPSHRSGDQRIDYNIYTSSEVSADFHLTSSCEIPRPWSREDFYKMIGDEVKVKGALQRPFSNERYVELTFGQWRHFWKSHGCVNDVNSLLNDEVVVAYYPSSLELSVFLPIKVEELRSKEHKLLDIDYFGNPIPQDGKALPGAFQNIKRGFNMFKVWNGLEIIGKDELPDFEVFNN